MSLSGRICQDMSAVGLVLSVLPNKLTETTKLRPISVKTEPGSHSESPILEWLVLWRYRGRHNSTVYKKEEQ